MMRNNFNEKAKGFVELKLGSPESIDMVMMFFYGQFPKLTMENVSAVMHLAEFLLIPNLKAFCVNWIRKDTKMDEENIENLLHLSSIFDFKMLALTKYIRQHLPELLGGNQLLTITADTLENMFSDATLSYVNADVRFEFMIRWVEHSPEQRKPKLDKIIAGIELSEVTVGLIEKAKGDKHFEDLQNLYETETETVAKMQNVLITQNDLDHGFFWVFDLAQERWFRIKSTCNHLERAFTFTYAKSTLCVVEKISEKCFIRLHDCLDLDELTYNLVSLITSHDQKIGKLVNIYISDKVCYVVSKYPVLIKKKERVQGLSHKAQRTHRMSTSRSPTNMTNASRMLTQRPTILLGVISGSSNETILTPLLSMNIDFEVILVVNDAKLIALFSKVQKFFCIYDQHSCKMKILDIELKCHDEVSPFKDGFVICDQKKIRFIQSQTGLRNERIFSVYETYPYEKTDLSTLVVVRNKWVRYRIKRRSHERSDFFKLMEYTSDELGKVSANDAKWKQIPLPDDNVDDSIIRNIQEIEIPRYKLKCNVKCPHCDRIKAEECRANLFTVNARRYTQLGVPSDWNDHDDYNYDYDDNYDYNDDCYDHDDDYNYLRNVFDWDDDYYNIYD